MRPARQDVIERVDGLVSQLDQATIENVELPATSSYAVIVEEWERFKMFVGHVDAAVADPFSDDAADWLSRADRLTDHDAYRLSFWLTHVAEAISRQ